MRLVPVTRRESIAFIRQHHRHHMPASGYRWAVGCQEAGKLVGVIIIGRPVSRHVDYRKVAEVTRLATDGTKNACSFLYSAAARAARAMGYEAIQTYILASEPGTSLRASGWRLDGLTKGGPWARSESRQLLLSGGTRRNDHPMTDKQRWVKTLTPGAGEGQES